MQFEVIAKCHTTKARVSRMKLARWSFLLLFSDENLSSFTGLIVADDVFSFLSFSLAKT